MFNPRGELEFEIDASGNKTVDPKSKIKIEMWVNRTSKPIETAYPRIE